MTGSVLTDFTVTVPTVQSTDAWAGLPLGIWLDMYSAGGNTGVFLDNVRLTSTAVPEPSTLALLAGGLFGLVAYAWKKRK